MLSSATMLWSHTGRGGLGLHVYATNIQIGKLTTRCTNRGQSYVATSATMSRDMTSFLSYCNHGIANSMPRAPSLRIMANLSWQDIYN